MHSITRGNDMCTTLACLRDSAESTPATAETKLGAMMVGSVLNMFVSAGRDILY